MRIRIALVRHGKTLGNGKSAYIGKNTDESLSEEGRIELETRKEEYHKFSERKIISGYMKRVVETAKILFPDNSVDICENLSEMDFGIFEGKNYEELKYNKEYQRWVDSKCESQIPGGEKKSDFTMRSNEAILNIIDKYKSDMVIICHGGNIMSFLSEYTGENYYDFHVKNGEGYDVLLNYDAEKINVISYDRV